ncbi:MAG: hypothetical protein IID33_05970, partial [Planctomycetes bacterium]|nr:hypothetical protein [Planctomycetota bacterium]
MRPDVKLGIVVSAVFVTVAGTYFLVQDRQESAIPVSSDPAALAGTDDKTTPSAAKPVSRNPPTRTASRRNSATAPSGNQRTN